MTAPTVGQNFSGTLYNRSPANIRQIVDPFGEAYKATATETLWVSSAEPFAIPREGNVLTRFTTGAAYFGDLCDAIPKAQKSIYIGDWQINWDAEMQPGVRLFDLLLKAARSQPTLRIYVMPWKHSPPVQTYDRQTKSVFEMINNVVGRQCVHVTLAASLADDDRGFFSHHQKFVVVDEKIAYVGGMDLCYGRFDDATYDLRADANGRQGLNRYNGCIPHLGKIDAEHFIDPDLLTGDYDRYISGNSRRTLEKILDTATYQLAYDDEVPYWSAISHPAGLTSNRSTLDPATQPRMPWQDVHVKIDGPSAVDVARNFALRWNSEGGTDHLPVPADPPIQTGGCKVQVLRSAPLQMRLAEYRGKSAWEKVRPTVAESDIATAMANLINNATSFIYIENQFFVSGFGSEQIDPNAVAPDLPASVPDARSPAGIAKGAGLSERATQLPFVSSHPDEAPKNFICEKLGERIHNAIVSGDSNEQFHVIITLPVHPEGMLNDPSVMTQVHWTMQSLVFGTFSLLNRVRRSLMAKRLYDQKVKDWKRVLQDSKDSRYESIDVAECRRYVTLLNLRNWEKLGDRYVTEQIYGHTKTMIVDDLFALVGSANINDRSMLGKRDSEIAVLISDSHTEQHDIDGSGKPRVTRTFARELRKAMWSKIFGITGGVRPATSLQIAIDQPANPKSWQAIQAVADKNRDMYEAAFDFIPRNRVAASVDSRGGNAASIWPRWNKQRRTMVGTMPFDEGFWRLAQHSVGAAASLEKIAGFIVSLPIEWTKGENNNIGFATSLVAENNVSRGNRPDEQLSKAEKSNEFDRKDEVG